MSNILQTAFSPAAFREQGHHLIDFLADQLANAQAVTIGHTILWQAPDEQLAFWQADFARPLLTNPQELFEAVFSRSVSLHSRGYLGHQAQPPANAAVLASTLTSFLNNGMAVYEMGMTGNALERIVTGYIARKMGFDDDAGGLITSGGTLGNLTALLAARAAKSAVWQEGNRVDNPFAVMVSEEAHYCIDRATRIMGLGAAGIIKVPVNAHFQLRTDLLEAYYTRAVEQGKTILGIIGCACSTATGSYDDLEAIGSFARNHQLWFHVDAAHGGAAIFSPIHQSLLKGIDQADSVVLDFHKMMLTPSVSTAVLFRRGSDANRTFSQQAQYLWDRYDPEEWYNSGKRTFECTKPMSVVAIYTLMRQYGDELFKQNVEVLYELAQEFANLISAHESFELAYQPQSNIVCFRYCFGDELDTANQQLLRQLTEEGRFYIVSTRLHGKFYLRTSIMNPLTTLQELVLLLETLEAFSKRDSIKLGV